jgi:hypothetical protein
VREAEKNKKAGLVFCKRDIIVESKSPETNEWINIFGDLQTNLNCFKKTNIVKGTNILRSENLLKKQPFNKIGEPIATLFSKRIVDEIGYFNEELVQLLDFEFYYRIFKKHSVLMINESLVAFRLHPLQASNLNQNRNIQDYEIYQKLLYKNFFWQLHYKTRWMLFKRYSPFYRKIVTIKKKWLK